MFTRFSCSSNSQSTSSVVKGSDDAVAEELEAEFVTVTVPVPMAEPDIVGAPVRVASAPLTTQYLGDSVDFRETHWRQTYSTPAWKWQFSSGPAKLTELFVGMTSPEILIIADAELGVPLCA